MLNYYHAGWIKHKLPPLAPNKPLQFDCQIG